MAKSVDKVKQTPRVMMATTVGDESRPLVASSSVPPKEGDLINREKLLKVHSVFTKQTLPRSSFSFGVANALFKSYIVGAMPGCLWLYCLMQWPFLFAVVARRWARRNYLLYFAEFCWVANIFGWLFLAMEALTAFAGTPLMYVSDESRLKGARLLFGVANGPLAMALVLNSNALVFHDPERTASFFIHFTPALVSWTMRWFQPLTIHEIAAALHVPFAMHQEREGTLFAIDHEADMASPDHIEDLYVRPWLAYFSWWIVYSVWLLSIGFELPSRGWGRSSFMDFRPKIQSLLGIVAVRTQACAFLLGHLVSISLILLLPQLLYRSFLLHTCFLLLLLLSVIHHGGAYYHHAFGAKLEKAIDAVLLE